MRLMNKIELNYITEGKVYPTSYLLFFLNIKFEFVVYAVVSKANISACRSVWMWF